MTTPPILPGPRGPAQPVRVVNGITFWTIAGGVFVGGFLLVIAYVFLAVALAL